MNYFVSTIYIVIGIIVANNLGYLIMLVSLPQIVSALLAIALWPLLLLGVNLHVAF
jgi:hypothetical protein